MPDSGPIPPDFDSELKEYFGVGDHHEGSVFKSSAQPDAVVADIRLLMTRGNRGYYLVKSYVLNEMNAILYNSCIQLNSEGINPELSPNLENALRKNESGQPKIRVITEDHIDFSRKNNREAIARIIKGEAGLHLDGVYLVIGLSDQTYKNLTNSLEDRTRPKGRSFKFPGPIKGNSFFQLFYVFGIIVTLAFGLTYTFYSSRLFNAGFSGLAVTFIVLWFLVPFLFFVIVRKAVRKQFQFYVVPIITSFLATLISGGIQGSAVNSTGPSYYFGYPFLYFDFYRAEMPVGSLPPSFSLTFGFSWLGLFLDLIAWFCLSIIAVVIAGFIGAKYGERIKLKLSLSADK
jgi:hypothetical protein